MALFHSQMQWRNSMNRVEIDVGLAREQLLHHVDILCLVRNRVKQRSALFLVLVIDECRIVKEFIHDLIVALVAGDHQRSAAFFSIFGIHVGRVRNERLYALHRVFELLGSAAFDSGSEG